MAGKPVRMSPTIFDLMMVYGWALLLVSLFSIVTLLFILIPYVNHASLTSAAMVSRTLGSVIAP
jgi:hypothetical protein